MLTFDADGRQSLQGTLAVESLDLTPYVSTYPPAYRREELEPAADRPQVPQRRSTLDLRISAANITIDEIKLGRTAVAANLRSEGSTLRSAKRRPSAA